MMMETGGVIQGRDSECTSTRSLAQDRRYVRVRTQRTVAYGSRYRPTVTTPVCFCFIHRERKRYLSCTLLALIHRNGKSDCKVPGRRGTEAREGGRSSAKKKVYACVGRIRCSTRATRSEKDGRKNFLDFRLHILRHSDILSSHEEIEHRK